MQVNLIENERSVVAARIGLNRARLNLQQVMGVETELGLPVNYPFPKLDLSNVQLLPHAS